MIPLDKCFRYEPEIKRLTKASSFIADGRVIYIAKKDHEGKPSKFYVVYDYKTRIQLGFHSDKDFLIDYIKKKDLSILKEIKWIG